MDREPILNCGMNTAQVTIRLHIGSALPLPTIIANAHA